MIIENIPSVCEGIEQRMQSFPAWELSGSFANIHAAITQITEKKPDLLFMDWGLSGGSAFEILHKTQNIADYDPYIIFNTGFQADNPEIPEKLINEFKVDKYLVKPIWENLRLHLAEYLKEAVIKAERKRNKKEVWVRDIHGLQQKVDLTLLVCICQHPNLPRARNMYLLNHINEFTTHLQWQYVMDLLQQADIDYFVTKHRSHLVVKSHIQRYERPFIWLNGLSQFKLDVTKESIKTFEQWLLRKY